MQAFSGQNIRAKFCAKRSGAVVLPRLDFHMVMLIVSKKIFALSPLSIPLPKNFSQAMLIISRAVVLLRNILYYLVEQCNPYDVEMSTRQKVCAKCFVRKFGANFLPQDYLHMVSLIVSKFFLLAALFS